MAGTICKGCGDGGGRFTLIGDDYYHTDRCEPRRVAYRDAAKSTFPFVCSHIGTDGMPITVNSLHHLRKLEAAHGVQSFAYNSDNPERRDR